MINACWMSTNEQRWVRNGHRRLSESRRLRRPPAATLRCVIPADATAISAISPAEPAQPAPFICSSETRQAALPDAQATRSRRRRSLAGKEETGSQAFTDFFCDSRPAGSRGGEVGGGASRPMAGRSVNGHCQTCSHAGTTCLLWNITA